MTKERFDPAIKAKIKTYIVRGIENLRLRSEDARKNLNEIAVTLKAVSDNALQEAGRLYSQLSLEDKTNSDISPEDLAISVMR